MMRRSRKKDLGREREGSKSKQDSGRSNRKWNLNTRSFAKAIISECEIRRIRQIRCGE